MTERLIILLTTDDDQLSDSDRKRLTKAALEGLRREARLIARIKVTVGEFGEEKPKWEPEIPACQHLQALEWREQDAEYGPEEGPGYCIDRPHSDGADGYTLLAYCPWCGVKLPTEKVETKPHA